LRYQKINFHIGNKIFINVGTKVVTNKFESEKSGISKIDL